MEENEKINKLKKREDAVVKVKSGRSVIQVAEEVNVHRSTLYRWIKKAERGESLEDVSRAHKSHPHKKEDSEIAQLLEVSLTQPFWGCKTLAKVLSNKGISMSSKTVQNILKSASLENIKARAERTIKAYTERNVDLDNNLLRKLEVIDSYFQDRNFRGVYPGEILLGGCIKSSIFDFFFPHLYNEIRFPVAIIFLIDTYSNYVVAALHSEKLFLVHKMKKIFPDKLDSLYLESIEDFPDLKLFNVVGLIKNKGFFPSLCKASEYFLEKLKEESTVFNEWHKKEIHKIEEIINKEELCLVDELNERLRRYIETSEDKEWKDEKHYEKLLDCTDTLKNIDDVEEKRDIANKEAMLFAEEKMEERKRDIITSQIRAEIVKKYFEKNRKNKQDEAMEVILPIIKKKIGEAVYNWNNKHRSKHYPTFGRTPAEIVAGYVYKEKDYPRREPVKDKRVLRIIKDTLRMDTDEDS